MMDMMLFSKWEIDNQFGFEYIWRATLGIRSEKQRADKFQWPNTQKLEMRRGSQLVHYL